MAGAGERGVIVAERGRARRAPGEQHERREPVGVTLDVAEREHDRAEQKVAVARIGAVVLLAAFPVEPELVFMRAIRAPVIEIVGLDRAGERRRLAEQLALVLALVGHRARLPLVARRDHRAGLGRHDEPRVPLRPVQRGHPRRRVVVRPPRRRERELEHLARNDDAARGQPAAVRDHLVAAAGQEPHAREQLASTGSPLRR